MIDEECGEDSRRRSTTVDDWGCVRSHGMPLPQVSRIAGRGKRSLQQPSLGSLA
jgi:hypothetical protein